MSIPEGPAGDEATMTTEPFDHRAEGERYRLAAIHDEHRSLMDRAYEEQCEQTATLHVIRDLLAHSLGEPTTGTSPRRSHVTTDGGCTGDIDCPVARHVHGCYADKGACDDPAEHEHSWKRQQNVTSRGYAMDPIEVCDCGTARRAADPEPVSESVTLPRDVVDLALDRLDKAARWAGEGAQAADARGHMEAWRALADALDAAGGEQP